MEHEALIGLPERILGWAGDDDDWAGANDKLSALRTLLMIHAAIEVGLWAYLLKAVNLGIAAAGLVLALALALALGWRGFPCQPRMGTALAAFLMFGVHLLLFPGAANHLMLVFLGLLALAFFDTSKSDEAMLALASLRWLTVIVLFSTGLQKVLYETYFHGEYLAWSLAHEDRFTAFLQYAISAEELERLRRLAAGATDAGVYRTQELGLLIASNASYIAELLLPLLLIVRRTRPLALIATLAFLVLIEAGAREVLFGVLFVNFVLLFSSKNWIRRLLPASVALYLFSLASQIGLLPGWSIN